MALSLMQRIAALREKVAKRHDKQLGVSPLSSRRQQPGVSPPKVTPISASLQSASSQTICNDPFGDVRAIPFAMLWPVLLSRLGIHAVRDPTYRSSSSARYRIKLYSESGGNFVLVINPSTSTNGDQFFDENRGRGGGGSIDLLRHILPTWTVKGCAAWLRKHVLMQ